MVVRKKEEEEEEENVVVVAVKAEGEISKAELTWALTHIVRPGDLVTLLAVLSKHEGRGSGWRRWIWGGLGGGSSSSRSHRLEKYRQISASSTQMALQIDGQNKVNVRIKVVGSEVAGGGCVVTAESKRVGAHWVVLDKNLKRERKHCLEELQCNIVVMKGSHAKVLRLNLGGDKMIEHSSTSPSDYNVKAAPTSSLGHNGALTPTSSNTGHKSGQVFSRETNPLFERFGNIINGKLISSKEVTKDSKDYVGMSDYKGIIRRPRSSLGVELSQDGAALDGNQVYWIHENHISSDHDDHRSSPSIQRPLVPPTTNRRLLSHGAYNLREENASAIVLSSSPLYFDGTSSPSNPGGRPPPPLCTLCRHKAPFFGKPPRRFAYGELVEATGGFSDGNSLGRHVHRGILLDGQVVAVKELVVLQPNCPSLDDDLFHAEVESLSRAQHRNVVMLVGFCIEGKRRLLVYEYICNGSLERHLHGREQDKPSLDWRARVKIAVGAARGLRYLHEDCRVGLVHGGLRTNHILLTHDFEPMIGGFSLTKYQTKRSDVMDTHAIEAFGYQAPEYIEHGTATEKVDVYAFGVVLLEILSGRRALDMTQPKGQQLLTEWARPFLSLALDGSQTVMVDQLLDPCLDRDQAQRFSSQLYAMYCAAFLCLRLDPQTRPNMSKIIKVFEGDAFIDPSESSEFNLVGSRSSRINTSSLEQDVTLWGSLSLRFPYEATNDTFHVDTSWSRFH